MFSYTTSSFALAKQRRPTKGCGLYEIPNHCKGFGKQCLGFPLKEKMPELFGRFAPGVPTVA